jgi:hypothetical protein
VSFGLFFFWFVLQWSPSPLVIDLMAVFGGGRLFLFLDGAREGKLP